MYTALPSWSCEFTAEDTQPHTHTHTPLHLVGVLQKSPEASDRKEGRENPLRRKH